MAADKQLVPVFIPALAPILLRAEQLKRSPLTEEEVIRIRDEAECVMVPVEVMHSMEESRGYRDIDPENCRTEWQNLRVKLINGKGDD